MLSLTKLYPKAGFYESIDENINKKKVFTNLSRIDQAIVIVATAIMAIITLNFYTQYYFCLLMNRFATSSMLDVKSPTFVLKEGLERELWTDLSKNEKLFSRFQSILQASKSEKEKAAYFLSIYLKERGDDVRLEEKEILIEVISKQIHLSTDCFRLAYTNRDFSINEHAHLKIYSTRGDGSCGFHAIRGVWSNNVYKCENIAFERQQFCHWLKAQHTNQALPEKIFTILSNYFLDFEYAPYSFSNATFERYQAAKVGFDALSDEEQRKRIEAFISHPLVIDAYIAHLQNVGTFLLQDELIAVGEYYGLRVLLFQPGWGNDSDVIRCNVKEALRPNFQLQDNDVCVYFFAGHYERAVLENREPFQVETD